MDRADIAAQQQRLAEHRRQQEHTKQPDRTTSVAKQIDPQGQPFPNQPSLKPTFQKAHDHAIAHGDKKGPLVSPQLREQDAARPAPAGMNGPTPPLSTGREVDRQAHLARLKETDAQAKARQEQADHGKMKDGKDHD